MVARFCCRCGNVCDGVCGCSAKQMTSTVDRGYDSRWRRLSERIRRSNPLCEECLNNNRVTASVDVHHIIPIKDRPDLKYDMNNLVALCRACHVKIEAESRSQVGGG